MFYFYPHKLFDPLLQKPKSFLPTPTILIITSPFLIFLLPVILFGFIFTVITSFLLLLPIFCALIFPFCAVYYVLVSSFCRIRYEWILKVIEGNVVARLTPGRVVESKNNGVPEGNEKCVEGVEEKQDSFELDPSESKFVCNSEEEEKQEQNKTAPSLPCREEDDWEYLVPKFGAQDELQSFEEVLSFWRRKEEGDMKKGLETNLYCNTLVA